MRQEIKQLIEDIKKVQEAQVLLARVNTIKLDSEINKLLDYAIKHKIIKSTIDIVDICLEIPEIKDIVCSSYDDYIKSIKDKQKAVEERYDNRYAGTYGSLREVPGYGTEWNERCIPSGVVISGGRNARC